MLCKWIVAKFPKVLDTRLYRHLKDDNYGFYLYSEPVNYVLIAIFFSFEGFDMYGSNLQSFGAFSARFFISLAVASLVVTALGYLRKRRLKMQPQPISKELS